jgi:hypothetical protein
LRREGPALIAEKRDAGATPLPEGLGPHKLRHTFASLLAALSMDLGLDPGALMEQLGHASLCPTMSIYRHAMRRDEGFKDQLRALVGVEIVAGSGSSEQIEGQRVPVESNGHSSKVVSVQSHGGSRE